MTNCPICGKELSQNSKYCPGCGNPVQKIGNRNQPTTLQCTCKNCGGTMNYDPEQSILLCPFCGAKEIVIEDEDITIARIRSDAYKEIELKKLEHQRRQDRNTVRAGGGRVKSGCFGIAILVIGILCFLLGLAGCLAEDFLAGSIAIIQGILFFFAWLLMTGRIQKAKLKFWVPLAAALILIIPFCIVISETSSGYRNSAPDTPYDWPAGSIADVIPQPDGENGTLYYQSEDSMSLDVSMGGLTEFREYVNACKDNGFTVDVEGGNNRFSAYNEEGYHLDLYYYESENYMSISLDAPIKMTTFRWPTSEIGQTLPAPVSDYGQIVWENNTGFSIYVGNTTQEEFEEYCSACMDAGYSENYSRGKGYFNAEDENGNELSIYYEGNKTMRIHLYSNDD